MKTIVNFTLAAALLLAAPFSAFAQEFTKGTVKKVDVAAKKVTITHEDLKNLDMPGMTMVFRVKDDAILAKLKEGADIEFIAERADGKLACRRPGEIRPQKAVRKKGRAAVTRCPPTVGGQKPGS